MMRGFWTFILLVSALVVCTSCGSVVFSDKKAETVTDTPAEPELEAVVEDCDALMGELAEACFMVTAYAEDGETVLHVIDELGNDLGEIDLDWVASYCECYAQLSFQTFGCSGVLSHEDLDDQAYEEMYGSIRSMCAQPVDNLVPVIECDPNDLECLEWQQSLAHEADASPEEVSGLRARDSSHCQDGDAACIEAAKDAAELSEASESEASESEASESEEDSLSE